MTNVYGLTDWFTGIEAYDKDHLSDEKLPFKMRVAVPDYDITPRNAAFEWVLDMGRGYLEAVLRHQPLTVGSITWYLPERWLSVHEQRMLIWQLLHHPDAAKLEQVDILTQNPLIIGDSPVPIHKVSLDGGGDGVTQDQIYKAEEIGDE